MTADERMIKRNAPYDLCDIRIRDASDKELEEISSAPAWVSRLTR